MIVALLIVKAFLGILFLASSTFKWLKLSLFQKTLREFGVPYKIIPGLVIFFPLAETVIGAGLLFITPSLWFGLAAVFLLLLFIAAITVNILKGRRPACNCFGQFSAKPISWWIILRNLILATGALLITLYSGPGELSLVTLIADLPKVQILIFIGILIAALTVGTMVWLLFQMLRQQGRLLIRLDAIEISLKKISIETGGDSQGLQEKAGPAIGLPAPGFELENIHGALISLRSLLKRGKAILLIFTDPACKACSTMFPLVAKWQNEMESYAEIFFISRGTVEANLSKQGKLEINNILLQKDREVGQAYFVTATPSAVLIRSDGNIGQPLATGQPAITRMVEELQKIHKEWLTKKSINGAASERRKNKLNIGERAPHFNLPDLEGHTLGSDYLYGRPTLVLFWNPQCGYCQRMLDDLKQWIDHPPKDAPQLLVISTGSIETNRLMGLKTNLLLEEGFRTAAAFGASGTPSAILIDAQGNIASGIAVGAGDIFKIASSNPIDPITFANN
jgi:peroxiredoxin/uncharacterized membrane protein YphA (DoxX/SURF4 family)